MMTLPLLRIHSQEITAVHQLHSVTNFSLIFLLSFLKIQLSPSGHLSYSFVLKRGMCLNFHSSLSMWFMICFFFFHHCVLDIPQPTQCFLLQKVSLGVHDYNKLTSFMASITVFILYMVQSLPNYFISLFPLISCMKLVLIFNLNYF